MSLDGPTNYVDISHHYLFCSLQQHYFCSLGLPCLFRYQLWLNTQMLFEGMGWLGLIGGLEVGRMIVRYDNLAILHQ